MANTHENNLKLTINQGMQLRVLFFSHPIELSRVSKAIGGNELFHTVGKI